MHKVVTFGELMLRLSPPGFERLFQSPLLVSTAYLSVFLIYAAVLLLGVSAWQSIDSVRVAGYSGSRRELGIAAMGAVALGLALSGLDAQEEAFRVTCLWHR